MTKDAARETTAPSKRTARQARKVPRVAEAEGQIKGAAASEDDLPIARYNSLTVDEITGRLAGLSQIDLAKVDAYERKNLVPVPCRAAGSRGAAARGDDARGMRTAVGVGLRERATLARLASWPSA